ncbi:MAG TPA: SDR family oxidoreductase [Solirubrobacteraceae bacterium]|nr:SDR family oxidoreductase [Solirubrobacteraceae bacterium]
MDYDLGGRVVLVSGAASGIGRATAERLAGMGARIVAADIDADAGEAAAAALSDGGAEVRFVAADVADEDAAGAMVAAAIDGFGRLDGAANCAGVGAGHAETHDYPVDVWDRIVAINLRGTWLAMRAEIPAILAHGDGGAIVNVASTLALRGSPNASPYSASKHGVIGLTRTAAIEYAQRGIRVNAVCPGAIDTPMMEETFARFPGFREMLTGFVPMGRMGAASEVAAAIAWLLSDGASFVTGEALTVEGGLLSR